MKIAISIPDNIFNAVKRAAEEQKRSRSEVIVEAVKTYLEKADDAVSLEASLGSLADGATYPAATTLVAPAKNLKVTVDWDSDDARFPQGSDAYMQRMSGLMTTAVRDLVRKANLQDNQALYNVRISAPAIDDAYMAYFIFGVAFWNRSRAQVSVTADVIEFT